MVLSVAETNAGHGTLLLDSHLRPDDALSGSHMNSHTNQEMPIRKGPFGTKKKVRIAMLGAGFSGLNLFKSAEQKLENVEIVCYEKNRGVGGIWLENRYPRYACDIPSVAYQFPWRPVCALPVILGYDKIY